MNFVAFLGVCVLAISLIPLLEWIRDRIEARYSERSAVARVGVLVLSVLIGAGSHVPAVVLIGLAAFVWLLMRLAAG